VAKLPIDGMMARDVKVGDQISFGGKNVTIDQVGFDIENDRVIIECGPKVGIQHLNSRMRFFVPGYTVVKVWR